MNAIQWLKQKLAAKKITPAQTDQKKQLMRVFTPPGYIAFFFKNICVVARSEREARRQYEILLRKEVKLMAGDKDKLHGK